MAELPPPDYVISAAPAHVEIFEMTLSQSSGSPRRVLAWAVRGRAYSPLLDGTDWGHPGALYELDARRVVDILVTPQDVDDTEGRA